ncbi:hypothetical protein QK309_00095 [Klebsiella quasipneumoniae]|uniref:hypothetical protein n=1 Tax=Klebsiella quasipneumoniae TaxID=1463165 RepID=UPI00249B4DE4|nr:hypothetical protein [Klebsiella quasipneumoniae]MDI3214132.1 hypothetical protein [Klebsiella quasipneumoniae]
MTSKLTRERVVALIAEHSYDSALVDALEHLLAAMDSEPVAVTDEELNAALQLHRLKVDGHSQLSDAFRAGFRYARRTTPQPAPVVPDGYVTVPKEPTDEMLAAAKEWTGLTSTAEVVYIKMLAAAPQEVKGE